MGKALYTHTPCIFEVEIATVRLAPLIIVGSHINVLTFVLDYSSVVCSCCTEGSLADFCEHL